MRVVPDRIPDKITALKKRGSGFVRLDSNCYTVHMRRNECSKIVSRKHECRNDGCCMNFYNEMTRECAKIYIEGLNCEALRSVKGGKVIQRRGQTTTEERASVGER